MGHQVVDVGPGYQVYHCLSTGSLYVAVFVESFGYSLVGYFEGPVGFHQMMEGIPEAELEGQREAAEIEQCDSI